MTSEISILIYQSQDEIKLDNFNNEFIQWLTSTYPEIPHLHLDSFCSSELISYGKKMIEKSKTVLMITMFNNGSNVNGLPVLLKTAFDHDNFSLLTLGDHPILEKSNSMIKILKVNGFRQLEGEVQKIVRRF